MDPDLKPIDLPPTPGEPPQPPVQGMPLQQPYAGDQPPVPGQPQVAPEWQAPPVINMNPKASPVRKAVLITLGIILVLAIGVGAWWWFTQHQSADKTASTPHTAPVKQTPKAQGLVLDPKKNYGNKYADSILPVGDGRYNADKAVKGFVYTCSDYTKNLIASAGQGGAGTRGPWFQNNNTEYDYSKKAHVQGNIMWQASFTNQISGGIRTITTNDLPAHPTGIFPIATNDPAYSYDRNPNTIAAQTLTYALNAKPTYGSASCMDGEVGVMLNGVALFNAFDAGGRDAGAWEVQDSCDGHPQAEGEYHYHTLSSCIKDTSVSTVIGFALDGFPITGPKVGANNILTTDDLDECHGLTSQINLDGKLVTSYHYVMTQDFPYNVSCFRSRAVRAPQPTAATQGGTPQADYQSVHPAPPQGQQSPNKPQP